jgi:flavin reductase (DIM6/NTAB) family NADH-FMN oxidoreductase RutF
VFILPVRNSRYSHGIIEKSGTFTVSVPRKDLTDVIMRCSGLSGRDHDKFSELHLHPVKARTVDTYIVGDCGLHFECRVVYRAAMTGEALDPALNADVYNGKNYHTLFYGEVLAVYET